MCFSQLQIQNSNITNRHPQYTQHMQPAHSMQPQLDFKEVTTNE
jgi:hypothetical protein